MLRLMPKMFALMTVQRQTAASRSARPWMRLQQGAVGGVPTTTLINPPSKSTQTPNFRASLGQVVAPVGVVGLGLGLGFGFGFDGQVPHALTKVKKRRLSKRNKVSDALMPLEPISDQTHKKYF